MNINEIIENFELLDQWDDRYRYIIELGRNLPELPEDARTEANKVRGCQSQVWLVAERVPATGSLHLQADSDAILVKGLIALVLRLYDHRPAQEILDNPPEVFERIGLQKFLTPGRANGLYAMVARIRSLAEAWATAATA